MPFTTKAPPPNALLKKDPRMDSRRAFDPKEAMDASTDSAIETYKRRRDVFNSAMDKYSKKIQKPYQTVAKEINTQYSDEAVIHFRSACLAKIELNVTNPTFKAIAEKHGIGKSYGNVLRTDYLQRPEQLPQDDLIEQYKEAYAEVNAKIRVMKSTGKLSDKDIAQQKAIVRSQRALLWSDLWRHFKRNFQRFPLDGLEALLMLEVLIEKKCVTSDMAEQAVNLILTKMHLFRALIPEDELPDE